MSVYDIDGNKLSSVYGTDGSSVQNAYDIDGNEIFPDIPTSLKVCTYNVGGWYDGSGTNVPTAKRDEYYALQTDIIESVDADIMCLEEYWSYFSGTERAATMLTQYYPYTHGVNGGSQYYGRCVCSKYPIINYVENNFSVETQRYYDMATIDVGGINVYVFVTHLSASNDANKITQATQLHNYIQNLNIDKYIVFGDFNSSLFDPMSETNIGIYQRFLDSGCALANGGAFGILPTYCGNAEWDDARGIDNIIVSDAFTIDSVATNQAKLNNPIITTKIDHIPLYATISFNEVTL